MKAIKLSFQMILLMILVITFHKDAFCYEIETHRAITSKAIGVTNIGSYLQNNLDIQISTLFKDSVSDEQRSVFSWIVEENGLWKIKQF